MRRGERVLDLGCGGGRHAFEAARRGARVVALDAGTDEVEKVRDTLGAMVDAGEITDPSGTGAVQGDALRLPFPDGSFDRVIAAEVLEHIPDDTLAMSELVRVLRRGGLMAVTVPRFGPELVNWALSDDYHNVPGGHVRIYRRSELVARLESVGLRFVGNHYAHSLHSPYWWLRCAVGPRREDNPHRERVPPDARLGHHKGPVAHPDCGSDPQSFNGQEPRRLRKEAAVTTTDRTWQVGSPASGLDVGATRSATGVLASQDRTGCARHPLC